MPLYITPQRREWVGLTSGERKILWAAANNPTQFGELLEAKLKDKEVSPLFKDIETIRKMKVDEKVNATFPKPSDEQKKVIEKLVKDKPIDEVKEILENYKALLP